MNNYRVGQFTVTRLWPKWIILERGSDGITRQVPVGSFWSWTWAARTAEIMRRIYCDGQDWDGNGPPRAEEAGITVLASEAIRRCEDAIVYATKQQGWDAEYARIHAEVVFLPEAPL